MGLFTNTESYNEYEVAAESYSDVVTGRLDMMVEACQDDMAFFAQLINNDVNEVNAMREGADVVVLAENAVTDAFSKLREFIKKVWAKIKGLVKAFIARVEGFVAKDGKAFAKKYNAIALKNVSEGRCKKIKFKFRAKNSEENMIAGIEETAKKVNFNSDYVDDLVKDKMDSSELKEKLIDNMFGLNCEPKELKKEIVDTLLKDEDEQEGIEPKDITAAKSELEGNSGRIRKLKETERAIDKAFKEMLRHCDNAQKEADKYIGAKAGTKVAMRSDLRSGNPEEVERGKDETAADIYSGYTKKVTACRTILTSMQELSSIAISATSEVINIEFKQARKVMALAASATGRKKVNESMEYDESLDFILSEEAAFAVEA